MENLFSGGFFHFFLACMLYLLFTFTGGLWKAAATVAAYSLVSIAAGVVRIGLCGPQGRAATPFFAKQIHRLQLH